MSEAEKQTHDEIYALAKNIFRILKNTLLGNLGVCQTISDIKKTENRFNKWLNDKKCTRQFMHEAYCIYRISQKFIK